MKKVLLYTPGISTLNVGDQIIADGVKQQLKPLLDKSFVAEVSTHLPTSFYYMRHLCDSELKFVCGSNLLKSTFFGFKRQWDVTMVKSKLIGPAILVGTGWWQYNNKMNLYTKLLLKMILSKKYIHSVRDEYTKQLLEEIGVRNVINTSCPTMWSLTKEHCVQIPKNKSKNVVFTLTDYNRDKDKDELLVNILFEQYNKIYFFPQGTKDMEYIKTLSIDLSKINIISPSLDAYDKLLEEGNIDYIGTRLHGGIRALQKKVRSIIIAVDNRAIEKQKDFNLPVIERKNIHELNNLINSEISFDINIPIENIKKWKSQFNL